MAASMSSKRAAHVCGAINCTKSREKDPNLSFYPFPWKDKDTERCKRWIINTRRKELNVRDVSCVKNLILCEEHFEANQFMCPAEKGCPKKWKRLLPTAIPTLFHIPNPPAATSGTRSGSAMKKRAVATTPCASASKRRRTSANSSPCPSTSATSPCPSTSVTSIMAAAGEAEGPAWLSLFTTLALLLGSIYLYQYVVKRSRRWRWRQAGKDVVVVHCPRPGYYTPCISPFVLKLLTYLRLAQIPHKLDHEEPLGPKGLCPWISLNGEELTDSQLVMERLGQQYNKDFSSRLTEAQQAVARAFTIMMDEHLCWCLREWRFKVDNGRSLVEGMSHPWYVHLFKYFYLEARKQTLWHQGMGRHTHAQVQHMARGDLYALSQYLGEKSYLMGEAASEVDCCVFAFLANILYNYHRSPFCLMITEDYPNLQAYVERMKERLWPDWEQCLEQPPRPRPHLSSPNSSSAPHTSSEIPSFMYEKH